MLEDSANMTLKRDAEIISDVSPGVASPLMLLLSMYRPWMWVYSCWYCSRSAACCCAVRGCERRGFSATPLGSNPIKIFCEVGVECTVSMLDATDGRKHG